MLQRRIALARPAVLMNLVLLTILVVQDNSVMDQEIIDIANPLQLNTKCPHQELRRHNRYIALASVNILVMFSVLFI